VDRNQVWENKRIARPIRIFGLGPIWWNC